ncbi:MAG: non-homologous end-joining DNA ligase [Hyphomonadaceae bacterium]|nr:non-homologous end-joining DNA ligase [Hyphomonadaceae bacterium]
MKDDVHGVAVTHPEKLLWPAPPLTKRDLALYFEAQAAWMLPHVANRPCSILRAPDGVEGERFFQRHKMKGASAHIVEVQVAGEAKPYIAFNTVEALIAAAQIGAIELHPWNCRPGEPEAPGRLVFDLDPGPDVAFARVVDAAKEVRERLEAVGLAAFCKTSGGKGLHVVTPLKDVRARPGWDEAKAFTRELCVQMAADSPDRYVVNMAKTLRVGRVFLDYLRNDRTATAVAPLSPRARAGAPVSMPLTWAQVRAGLDPMRFTLKTAPALLGKSKAWADYAASERPLAPAVKKLCKSSR